MPTDKRILGIETSCDETGASLLSLQKNHLTVESNILASSLSLHAKTGGIIPEIAAREQLKYIIPTVAKAIEKQREIDAIAVTYGPGLIGSLLIGVETARTLSYVWKKPLIPVNHLLGHIYANWINKSLHTIEFPAVALIVSGGHTDLLYMKDKTTLQWIGGTRDDAAGEAFDKIGRLIGLASYPAGPAVENAAKKGDPKRFMFPRPLIHSEDFDFSFSGLKTAVLKTVQNISHLDEQTKCDIARGTEDAIVDVLVAKITRAVKTYNPKSILLGGGVAANSKLQQQLEYFANAHSLALSVPEKQFCTDNAAMIAACAFFNYDERRWMDIDSNPELYFA